MIFKILQEQYHRYLNESSNNDPIELLHQFCNAETTKYDEAIRRAKNCHAYIVNDNDGNSFVQLSLRNFVALIDKNGELLGGRWFQNMGCEFDQYHDIHGVWVEIPKTGEVCVLDSQGKLYSMNDYDDSPDAPLKQIEDNNNGEDKLITVSDEYYSTPDTAYDPTTGDEYSHMDNDAYPFIYLQEENQLYVGEHSATHASLPQYNSNDKGQIQGRIWTADNLVSFWEDRGFDIMALCKQLCDYFKIPSVNDIKIAYLSTFGSVKAFMNSHPEYSPKDIARKEQAQAIHLKSAEEKRQDANMKGYLDDRSQSIGKKLRQSNGKEMPQAEYNYYRRYGMGESRIATSYKERLQQIINAEIRSILTEGKNFDRAINNTKKVIQAFFNNASWLYNKYEDERNPDGLSVLDFIEMENRKSFHGVHDRVARLMPIIMKIRLECGFEQQNPDNIKLERVDKILGYIKSNFKKDDFYDLTQITLQNVNYDLLNNIFGQIVDDEQHNDNINANNKQNGKMNPNYQIIDNVDYRIAHEYGDYSCSQSKLCYTQNEDTWKAYTSNGVNKPYIILRNDWQNVKEEHGENTPYDDYGLSMIFIFVNENGDITTSNTRWNHQTNEQGPSNVDMSFTKTDISNLLNVNFDSVFKPYSEEELSSQGIMSFTKAQKLLTQGVNPHDIFDIVYAFHEGFATVELLGKQNFLTRNRELLSDQWFDKTSSFENGFAEVKLDGKYNFINKNGQIISNQWFDLSFGSLENGFTKVRLDGKYYLFYGETCDGHKAGDLVQIPNPYSQQSYNESKLRDMVRSAIVETIQERFEVLKDDKIEDFIHSLYKQCANEIERCINLHLPKKKIVINDTYSRGQYDDTVIEIIVDMTLPQNGTICNGHWNWLDDSIQLTFNVGGAYDLEYFRNSILHEFTHKCDMNHFPTNWSGYYSPEYDANAVGKGNPINDIIYRLWTPTERNAYTTIAYSYDTKRLNSYIQRLQNEIMNIELQPDKYANPHVWTVYVGKHLFGKNYSEKDWEIVVDKFVSKSRQLLRKFKEKAMQRHGQAKYDAKQRRADDFFDEKERNFKGPNAEAMKELTDSITFMVDMVQLFKTDTGKEEWIASKHKKFPDISEQTLEFIWNKHIAKEIAAYQKNPKQWKDHIEWAKRHGYM